MRWYYWCVVLLAHPPPSPKFFVRSNGWKTKSRCLAQFLPCLPSVRRRICICRCLPRHCCQTTPGWTVCKRQLVVPWLRWPQWCGTLLHHEPFRFVSNFVLNLLPGFNISKFNHRRPLPSRQFLLPSCWISCNSAVNFDCSVCTLYKKAFGLWHWKWRLCCHRRSWIYLRCCHPLCFRLL